MKDIDMIDDNYIKHMKSFQRLIVFFTIITLTLTVRAFNTGSIVEAIILTLATAAHIYSFSVNMNCVRRIQKKKNLLNNAIFLGKDYSKSDAIEQVNNNAHRNEYS